MEKDDLIILKIGGAVITNKYSSKPSSLNNEIIRIAKEIKNSISNSKFKLIIVHGAGNYGHPIVKKSGIDKGISNKNQLIELSKTLNQVKELNLIFCKKLSEENLNIFSYDASSIVLMENRRIKDFDLTLINNLISKEIIPVLYGTMAFDLVQICSVLSGDQIVSYLAKNLEEKYNIKKVIFATDVDGIYEKDPKNNPYSKIITEIKKNYVLENSNSKKFDVTGGMQGKLDEIFKFKTETLIINGKTKKNIEHALFGKIIGTLIKN